MGARTRLALVLGLGLLAARCGSSEPALEKQPSFTPEQASAAIAAIEATKLDHLGVAAGSETYGLTLQWTAEGKPLMSVGTIGGAKGAPPVVDSTFYIQRDFGDATYFMNNPTAACGRALSLSSATGDGRSKRADRLQAEIAHDLEDRCESHALTGRDIADVLGQHGFSIHMAAAGGSGVSQTQVSIDKKESAKLAAEHVAVLTEHPPPGIDVGAVGALVVQSRGTREGTSFVDASNELNAAMSALKLAS